MNHLPDSFSLRHGEGVVITLSQPTSGEWIAVMRRTVWLPGSSTIPERNGRSVTSHAAVLACSLTDGEWRWLSLSVPAKHYIGSYLEDFVDDENGFSIPHDVWVYATITREQILPADLAAKAAVLDMQMSVLLRDEAREKLAARGYKSTRDELREALVTAMTSERGNDVFDKLSSKEQTDALSFLKAAGKKLPDVDADIPTQL